MSRRRKALALLMRSRMRPTSADADPSPPSAFAAAAAEKQVAGGLHSLPRGAQFPPYHVGETHPSPFSRPHGGGSSSETSTSVEAVKSLLRASVSSITRSSSAPADASVASFLKACRYLPSEERRELLIELARDYDVDRARVRSLMQHYLSLGPTFSDTSYGEVDGDSKLSSEDSSMASVSYRIEHNLRDALKPKYAAFIENINDQPGGLKLLLDLRADLLSLLKEKNCISLRALDIFLKEKLMTWLSPATLDLQHITWDSSASLLEKIVEYEAVHPIRNLIDLKKRLSSGRRCFGYLHPAIPGEPLIFIEVALLKHIACSIEEVLWETPPIPESEAICALFYSISSTQPGLTGVNLGRFLIKRVIQLVRREMPHVLTFATLSPVPGFIQWLLAKLEYGRMLSDPDPATNEDVPSHIFAENILQPEEEEQIIEACRDSVAGKNGMELLHNLLISSRTSWITNDNLMAILKPLLMRLCARYLLKEKKRGKAFDVVANFHLQNGAMLEKINWMADSSEKGLWQSAGIMVNYVYRLDVIEEYAESYSRTGYIHASEDLILTYQASL